MAAGDIIMSEVVAGAPFFPCGPCQVCHDKYGDDLNIVVAGVQFCAGCYTFDDGLGNLYDLKVNAVTINGMYSVTWGGSSWDVVGGAINFTVYATSDGTCGGVGTTYDEQFIYSIGCVPVGSDSFFTGGIQTTQTTPGAPKLALFASTLGALLDDPISNGYAIGDCGTQPSLPVVGYDGTITVSV